MTVPSPIGIVGLGLMGGSLARALSRLPDPPELVAWSRSADDLELARDARVIRQVAASPEEVAESAALVVYAVPLGAILGMLDSHRTLWRPDAVITDVASLKEPLAERARASGVADRFVGSHPMTGGESSGFRAARADLYRDVPVWIARDTGSPTARAAVEALWEAVEARPEPCGAREHDQRMVWASHLPQLTANALARVLAAEGMTRFDLGPGGRDMTRLAGSSAAVWTDLLEAAAPAVSAALESLGRTIHDLAKDLDAGRIDEVAAVMDATRRWREASDRGRSGPGSNDGERS